MDVATLPSRAQPALEDFERVEDYLRAYLAGERFKSAHHLAYERWSDAASTLYRDGSKDSVLAAGRKAREALQEFARALARSDEPDSSNAGVRSREPDTPNPDPTEAGSERLSQRGTDRLSSLLDSRRPRLGDSRCDLLQSLCRYWRVLDDVVQRHAPGAQRAGQPLRWEDGRRIVVLTALVMVEVDRSI
jgi:hypothetical protein